MKLLIWEEGINFSLIFLWLWYTLMYISRSLYRNSPWQRLYKIGAFKKLAKFTGIHLCRSLFLLKFLMKKALEQVFSYEFCKIFKNVFFTEQLRTRAEQLLYIHWLGSLKEVKVLFEKMCPFFILNTRLTGLTGFMTTHSIYIY